MSVQVRKATAGDFDTLVQLITALADYEQLPPPDEAAQMRFMGGWLAIERRPSTVYGVDCGNGDLPGGDRAVGYAITFETYSSFLARPSLYIEDIFVLSDARRCGIGNAIMDCLIEEAQRLGCGRLEWVVLDWNTSAQQFYQQCGATHQVEWQHYRLQLDPSASEGQTVSAYP